MEHRGHSLFDRLGADKIGFVVQSFYDKAFSDSMIGHFFHGRDQRLLVERQTQFAIAMLGGPKEYQGSPLGAAHRELNIRKPHFDRRQKLLDETMLEAGLAPHERREWLAHEEGFRKLIVTIQEACHKSPPPQSSR